MRKKQDWFPCYPSKLLGAIHGMRPPEALTYMILLLRIYENGGSCPDTLESLARRIGFNRRVVSDALNRLFNAGRLRREGDSIRNPVADQVLETQTQTKVRLKEAGRRGGLRAAEKRAFEKTESRVRRKTKQNQQNGHSPAIAMLQPGYSKDSLSPFLESQGRFFSESSSLPESNLKSESRTKNRSIARLNGLADDFEIFYRAYPRRQAKKAALKAFMKAMEETTLATILAALEIQKPKWKDPEYIPRPATWLNRGQWEDELNVTVASATMAR